MGGKYYGPCWQNLSKELRGKIKINGAETVELDFNAMHLHLLYCKVNKKLTDYIPEGIDAYQLPNRDRKIVKTSFTCCINDNCNKDNVNNVVGPKVAKKYPEIFVKNTSYRDILEELGSYHPEVRQFFYAQIGNEISNMESKVSDYIIGKLTRKNIKVTVVTRNIHQKSYIIKTQANAGYVDIVEASIFDEKKIRKCFENADFCINLVGILFEKKKGNTFKNIHSVFPSLLAKLSKQYNLKHYIHLSALGINEAIDSSYAKSKLEGENEIWIVVENEEGKAGHDVVFVTVDTPPSAPNIDSIGFGNQSLTVNFIGIEDADISHYLVYMSKEEFLLDDYETGGPDFKELSEEERTYYATPSENISFSLQPLTNEQTYYIAVRSYDESGMESEWSNLLSGTPKPTFAASDLLEEEGGYEGCQHISSQDFSLYILCLLFGIRYRRESKR
mgnify:CR=1 FL=1